MEKSLVLFADFDGTVSREDICYRMVKTFASHGWEELNQLWEQGVLTTGECAQRTLDLMQVKPFELEQFFQHMELNPGFSNFAAWTRENHFPLYILSDGYDNYIEPLLKRNSLTVTYYANHLEYDRGWKLHSPHINLECQKCGVCKSRLIERLSPPGVTTVYIGDGYSDRCPAQRCNLVFAKDSLADYCKDQYIRYYAYQNFYDILNQLHDMGFPAAT